MPTHSSGAHPGLYAFSTGARSPLGVVDVPPGGGAVLVLDAAAAILAVILPRPSLMEETTLAYGQVDLGLHREGASSFVLWRFRTRYKDIVVDTPFHVGLEDASPLDDLAAAPGQTGELPSVSMVMQDEKGIIRMMRVFSLPRSLATPLGDAVAEQLKERGLRTAARNHAANIRRFYRRMASNEVAFMLAPAKAQAAAGTSGHQ